MILVQDADFTLYVGDVLESLRELPDESVHCVVTSPPYWGLRDYGTGSWDGGDPDCDHQAGSDYGEKSDTNKGAIRGGPFKDVCGKCGATRVDQQLGLEATPDLFVASMVAVFREIRRVLRRDGTCWVNLGDSYAANAATAAGRTGFESERGSDTPTLNREHQGRNAYRGGGIKAKDLVGIPWRVALALQQPWLRCPTCNIEAHASQWRDVGEWLMCPNLCENESDDVPVSEPGWYLRSDIVWSKPNPMPESVTDRPTKAHEYVFLLTRSPRYFFDADAVRETALWAHDPREGQRIDYDGKRNGAPGTGQRAFVSVNATGRNVRSVWEIATQPYPEAHFATFPEELPRRCILAGCPVGGTVLDPFMGSGTTALVARRHGRRSIGIELNPEYAALCARRLQQLSLFAGEPA